MTKDTWRPLKQPESELLERLLTLNLDNHDRFVEQSRIAVARTIDSFGSFELDVSGLSKPVDQPHMPYADAQTLDADGVPVWITLFVKGGVLDEVDISRADGGPLLRQVAIEDLDVFAPARLVGGG
jgi:hypothetical protein